MRVRSIVVLLALAAVTATGCSGDDTPTVQTAPVVAGEVVQTVAAPAQLEPRERRTVTASVPGEVAELLVDDGDQVKAGDVVLRLTSDSVDLALAQAGAAVDAAGALTGVSLTPDLSPIIGSVRAQLEATLQPLITELSAQANEVADPAQRERSLTAVARLVNRYEGTRDRLLATERQARSASVSASAAQRAAAQAQQEQAEVALAAAEEQEDALVLVAPIAGIVELGSGGALPDLGGGGLDGLFGGAASGATSGPVAVGSLVAPGQALFTVYDLRGFHARATVDEIDVVLVEEGQRAVVLVDAFPDAELRAFVRRVAIAPEQAGTGGVVYPVEVELTAVPDDLALRVGLTASVEIVVRSIDSERVAPSSALRRRDGQEVVFVVRDGVVDVVPVEVIAIGEETAAVEGDVIAGDVVVVSGADTLDDGDELP